LDSLNALDKAARIRPDALLRDEAIAAMTLPDIRRVPGWHCSPSGTTTIALGGQYRMYARADNLGFISIRSLPDDQEIRRIASGPLFPGSNLYFSADERYVLGITQRRTLHVWRVTDGQPALRAEPSGSLLANCFSPDGRQLAVGQQNEVRCFNLETGQESNRWRLPAVASAMAFHPNNGKLAVGYENARAVSIYDAARGNLLAELPVGAINFQTVAWHPDGHCLAVAGSDPRIQIWNVAASPAAARPPAAPVPSKALDKDSKDDPAHNPD
jgi:WD40 repeat protein